MPQAYVAKPGDIVLPDTPPGWDPDWPFPGPPNPPGYNPAIRNARLTVQWVHGSITSGYGNSHSYFCRGIFYRGSELWGDNYGHTQYWDKSHSGSSIFVVADTGLSELPSLTTTGVWSKDSEFEAIVYSRYGIVNALELLDTEYRIHTYGLYSQLSSTFIFTLKVFYNSALESTTAKTLSGDGGSGSWGEDWLSIDGETGDITLINPQEK